jgi:GTP cyclohydrolase II
MYEAERGLFELQRGRPVWVTGSPASGAGRPTPPPAVLLASVEGLSRATLDGLRRVAPDLRLVVTRHRARAAGFDAGARGDVSLALAPGVHLDEIVRLSCVRGNLATTIAHVRVASQPEEAGLLLTKLGRLLPAIVGVTADPAANEALRQLLASGAVLSLTAEQIEVMAANTAVEVVHASEGPVPLEHGEDAQVTLFRESNGLLEHAAIVIGNAGTWPDPVPVRLHSACFTGDLFGSLRCDCGEQLRGSLRAFAAAGGGILVYLAQEGRGIGLANKLRAYELQAGGLDTEEADETLGFGADERRYETAVAILQHFGVRRIQLLTNNPHKVRAVQDGGIEVIDRQPLYGTLNRHNVRYVTTKVRAGHWLQEMLASELQGSLARHGT